MEYESVESDDNYWRLKPRLELHQYDQITSDDLRKELEGTNYAFTHLTHPVVLCWYLRRIDLGLLNYHACYTDELRRFVRDRQIETATTVHSTLIEALERADETLNFTRYLDLPPELRSFVYELYVAEFPCALGPCSQPPLAKTCKIIRKEMLPIFYRTVKLELELDFRIKPESWCLHLSDATDRFLARILPTSMAEIRKLKISADDLVICNITLSKDGCSYSLTVEGEMFVGLDDTMVRNEAQERVTRRHRVLDGVGNVIADTCKRSRKRLTVEDIYSVRRTLEDVFW